MNQQQPLSLPNYQRIYQFIYSVLEASGSAITHRSCVFFAATGAAILQTHYDLPATIGIGCMVLRVDKQRPNVVVYGRIENGYFVSDETAFHAWVECDGWLIDFMTPIMGVALQQAGADWVVPSRMLQKNLEDSKNSLGEIQHIGEFFVEHNAALADLVIDSQSARFFQLMDTCVDSYCKLPEPLRKTESAYIHSRLCAPSIVGA